MSVNVVPVVPVVGELVLVFVVVGVDCRNFPKIIILIHFYIFTTISGIVQLLYLR